MTNWYLACNHQGWLADSVVKWAAKALGSRLQLLIELLVSILLDSTPTQAVCANVPLSLSNVNLCEQKLGIDRHTTWCTSAISMVSQHKLLSPAQDYGNGRYLLPCGPNWMYYEKLHRARGLQDTLYMTEVYRVADSVMSRLQHVSCVKQCCFVFIFNICQELAGKSNS